MVPQRSGGAAIPVLLGLATAVVVLAAVIWLDPLVVGGILLVGAGAFVFRRVVFTWTTMLFAYVAVILFVPIRRYALPIDVGFALEPYRVLIAVLLIALAIAVVRRSRPWQPVVWGWPIAIFLWAMLFSLMVNAVTLTRAGEVAGGLGNAAQLAFLVSTVVLVRQLLSTEAVVFAVLNLLVIGGAVVGALAMAERFLRHNVFLDLATILPLQLLRDDAESLRAGGGRAYASAQHPIALAVLLCMLIPLAVYLMRFSPWPRYRITRRLFYTAAIGLMLLGMLAAVSRTGVVALGATFLFVLLLRPRLGVALLAIAVPLGVLAALALPQLFESMVLSLFDVEGLVASQLTSVGLAGQGRLADLPDAFAQFQQHPLAGTGVGSRVVVGAEANAQILDNQWLGTLLEAGVVGVVGAAVFVAVPIVAMVRHSFRRDVPESRAFLCLTIAASTVAYATAMFFYDAFAFMQTLLVLCLLYAIAAWAMTAPVRAVAVAIPDARALAPDVGPRSTVGRRS